MTISSNLAYWIAADHHAITVEDTVYTILGSFASEYNESGIAAELREAVNAALPEGVALHGDSFIGDPNVEVDYSEIFESIDFWAIADRHEIIEPNN